MQVYGKEMDLKKKKKSFGRVGTLEDVQILLLLKMCPTLGPEPTRERF